MRAMHSLILFVILPGIFWTSIHTHASVLKSCSQDEECAENEFCFKKYLRRQVCQECTDCSFSNRKSIGCARSKQECAGCLEGFKEDGDRCLPLEEDLISIPILTATLMPGSYETVGSAVDLNSLGAALISVLVIGAVMVVFIIGALVHYWILPRFETPNPTQRLTTDIESSPDSGSVNDGKPSAPPESEVLAQPNSLGHSFQDYPGDQYNYDQGPVNYPEKASALPSIEEATGGGPGGKKYRHSTPNLIGKNFQLSGNKKAYFKPGGKDFVVNKLNSINAPLAYFRNRNIRPRTMPGASTGIENNGFQTNRPSKMRKVDYSGTPSSINNGNNVISNEELLALILSGTEGAPNVTDQTGGNNELDETSGPLEDRTRPGDQAAAPPPQQPRHQRRGPRPGGVVALNPPPLQGNPPPPASVFPGPSSFQAFISANIAFSVTQPHVLSHPLFPERPAHQGNDILVRIGDSSVSQQPRQNPDRVVPPPTPAPIPFLELFLPYPGLEYQLQTAPGIAQTHVNLRTEDGSENDE